MVVSVKSVTTINPLDEFSDYVDSITETMQSIGQDVFNRVESPFKIALQFYPPVPAGSTYRRTLRLKRGWNLFYQTIVNGFQFVVSNLTKYTAWVVGSLDNVRSVAAQFQRKFHNRNGWPLAFDTIDYWFEIFISEFEDEFDRQLAQFATRKTKR